MYNVGLYRVRQFFFAEERYLPYEANYHHCKTNENYVLLHSQVAQSCLKSVNEAMEGFFKLLAMKKQGSIGVKVGLPRYLDKEGYFPLVYPQVIVENGIIRLPVSQEWRKQYRTQYKKTFRPLQIRVPPDLVYQKIIELRIVPRFNARYFSVQFVYEVEEAKHDLDSNSVLSIDLGINNLAACVDTNGSAFLIDGRKLKSINQWFNKEMARLQSTKDKQGIKGFTNRQAALTRKRNFRVDDYIKKAARLIVNHCIANRISKIVIGYNPGIKKEVNLGKVNNQKFVFIPHARMVEYIKHFAAKDGMEVFEQEESYTSQASFVDNDELPTWNADNPVEKTFSYEIRLISNTIK
ncbi:IS200/IS605 family element transposase accessory protein TnpB [Cyanobacteria bacterium FACHB-502]|nr:IS200/IS605 family element transposase accessory protein TnpB [Cyanobacteria bacterium FACHB-502]